MGRDEDEPELFRRTVGKVRRLEHEAIEPDRPRPAPRPRRVDASAARPVAPVNLRPGEADTDDAAGYFRPGLQRGVLRKLKRGQFPIGDELDLHGMTVNEAERRLAAFLARACGERVSCVRIVTGKGLSSPGMKAVLKPRVAAWLREDGRVLAFTDARRGDGGSGAFYVLLRSRRD